MKKLNLCMVILFTAVSGFAQLKPNGSLVTGQWTPVDINNNHYNLQHILDSGKNLIVVFFSAQDAANSWVMNNNHALQDYYTACGPGGTVADEGRIFLYDTDPATTLDDIHGTGSHTAGDWTAGNSFPIFNEEDFSGIYDLFLDNTSPVVVLPLPVMVLVCPDKKMYKMTMANLSAQSLRDQTVARCTVIPSGIPGISRQEFSFAPNPAGDRTIISLNLERNDAVSYYISNSVGQIMTKAGPHQTPAGISNLDLQTGSWPSGVYFIHLAIGNRAAAEKLIIAH